MRTRLQWAVGLLFAGFTVAFGIVFGTVIRQNIEVLSESLGTDSLFRDGWKVVTSLGLQSVVFGGFFLFGGATLALWIDRWLRRRESAAKSEVKILLTWKDDWVPLSYPLAFNIHHWFSHTRGASVLVCLVFDKPLNKPHLYSFSTASGVKWREVSLSDRHAIFEIEDNKKNSQMVLGAISEAARSPDMRRQQPEIWQDAIYFPNIPEEYILGTYGPGWRERLMTRIRRAFGSRIVSQPTQQRSADKQEETPKA